MVGPVAPGPVKGRGDPGWRVILDRQGSSTAGDLAWMGARMGEGSRVSKIQGKGTGVEQEVGAHEQLGRSRKGLVLGALLSDKACSGGAGPLLELWVSKMWDLGA